MLVNYLKIAVRNLLKNKLYSSINIFGLAIGLAAVLLILYYVRFELSYERSHLLRDRLYRISILSWRGDVMEEESPEFTPPIGPALVDEFPEVEQYTRLSTRRAAHLTSGDLTRKVEGIRYADSTLFDLFSFTLRDGDPDQALAAPFSVVLTERLARRLFGDENPMGRSLEFDGQKGYVVKGILADPPANSHLQFDLLISFSSLYQDPSNFMDWNGGNQYLTYILLHQEASPSTLASKLPGFMWRHINEDYAPFGVRLEAKLQPLSAIHLNHERDSKSKRTNLYVFSLVGLLILFIACVNFVNLTTARSGTRAREVGLRKVMGARRSELASQFLGESLVLCGVAFLLALLLAELASPLYGRLLGQEVPVSLLPDLPTLGLLFLLFLVVGLVAGSYPALVLSALAPLQSLRGQQVSGGGASNLARGLVVLQFSISAALIVGTLIVSRQLAFIKNKTLGFHEEQMVVLPLIGENVQSKADLLRHELERLPQVHSVTASSEVPGGGFTRNGYIPEGTDQSMTINVVDIDEAFLEAYDLTLVAGRNYAADRPADRDGYLVNESLARMMNWADPIGKKIDRNGEHRVIGVVSDFHFASLHSSIEPLIITNRPWESRFGFLSVRLKPGPVAGAVEAIRDHWQASLPGEPFDFWFLDDQLDNLYRAEARFREAFFYFSAFSILIALLGVFGLATFAIERRIREIGIRRVLGASVGNIVGLFSRDILRLVTLALVIAFPVAWWAMGRWLDTFAYQADPAWWTFATGGLLTLAFAFLTVSARALKAATKNPANVLKEW